MLNYYEILGVTKDTDEEQIKKRYKKLARELHPDIVCVNIEDKITLDEDIKDENKKRDAIATKIQEFKEEANRRFQELGEAYEHLIDPNKRSIYDATWEATVDDDIDVDDANKLQDILARRAKRPAILTTHLPISNQYKQKHIELVKQYKNAPVPHMQGNLLTSFNPKYYMLGTGVNKITSYDNIYSYLQQKEKFHPNEPLQQSTWQTLTPQIAIEILNNFLKGQIFGKNLIALTEKLATEIERLHMANRKGYDYSLYVGVYQILAMKNKTSIEANKLLAALKKITDYAQATAEQSMSLLAPLFQSKAFRLFYAYALHRYWLSPNANMDESSLNQFNGQDQAKELLASIKDRLLESGDDKQKKHLLKYMNYVKLLYNLDKDTNTCFDAHRKQSSKYYRDKAYHLLDWTEGLMGISTLAILMNTYLQAALYFQKAAQYESKPEARMADERLAYEVYLTAIFIAQKSTPDVEMYGMTYVLKYLQHFQYAGENVTKMIPIIQKRCLQIADIFPFYQAQQANTAFLKEENQSILLMRHLLQHLVQMMEDDEAKKIDIKIRS